MTPADSLNVLRQSNARLSTLLENLNIAVFVEDELHRLAYINHEFLALFGLTENPPPIGFDAEESFRRGSRFFADAEDFLRLTTELRASHARVVGVELLLVDDRIVELDHIPIFVEGSYQGTVWKFRDVTERRREQIRLRTYADQLHTVLTSMPLILWSCDMNGVVTMSEGQGLLALGFQPNQLVGQSLYEFNAHRPESLANIQRAMQGETFTDTTQSGDRFLETRYVPIFAGDRVIGVSGLSVDVTERHQMEFDLEESRDRALEASRLKSEFVATMSHEIRTPMNGIIGMSELILDTPLNDEQREFAGIIHHEARALLRIINDILDFSRMEAGKATPDPVPFSLEENIASVIDLVKADAEQKGLDLQVRLPQSIPMLYGDGGRLRQILVNLINNAIKFTKRGSVRVEVALSEQTAKSVRVTIAIHDTGIGIPESKMGLLFQPFMQIDGSIRRAYGGTGLGLAIVKHLVELLEGEITVRSSEGVGTSFTISIPFAYSGEVVALARMQTHMLPPLPEAAESNEFILVVDDNPMGRRVVQDQLLRMGYQNIDVAENGQEAIDSLRKAPERYRLILMDCQMPILDGFAATRQIRAEQSELALHTPIIALTANAMAEDRERCLAAGMDDYVTKPVSFNDLKAALERWIKG